MSQPVLVYEEVGKTFGKTRALTSVSLDVRDGEVFGLLGPNGAGKTTLIRIGLDILRPDQGRVTLFGKPLHRDTLDRVSYLPEERGLYKKTKVIDALVYFGRLKGLKARPATEAAYRWLEKVGMSHVARRNVETLSKGMSQKVQIAGALLSEPDLCVLDEPFSGLDPINMDLVKKLILERRETGKATILSTHMMSQVEALCDRVAIIHAGKRVIYGPLRDVRKEHSHPVVRVRCSGELPELSMAVRRTDTADGILLHLKEESTPDELLHTLVESGVRVHHFEVVLATMEQIFLDVVGVPVDA